MDVGRCVQPWTTETNGDGGCCESAQRAGLSVEVEARRVNLPPRDIKGVRLGRAGINDEQ